MAEKEVVKQIKLQIDRATLKNAGHHQRKKKKKNGNVQHSLENK